MTKKHLLTTGLNGLVGSKFRELFAHRYEFDSLDISHPTQPVDITNMQQVMDAFENSSADTVIHLAAFTNVTAAWEQRGDTQGLAYQVNVVGTEHVVKAAEETGKHLIHISTAYVFDGKNPESYVETDSMHPIEWYGQTKAQAEEVVQNSSINWTILRIDQPFRSDSFEKVDFVHRIIEGLQHDALYPLFTDHYIGPTFIDDFANVLDWATRTHMPGIYHASSGEKWSDYELAQLVKEIHSLPGKIEKGDLNTYLKTLNRPYQKNTSLNTDLLKEVIDVPLHSIKEALQMIKIS